MHRQLLALIASLGAATSLACKRPNPAFDDGDGASVGDTGASATSVATTSESPTSTTTTSTASTTQGATTGVVDPTSNSGTGSTTAVGSSSSSSSSTDGPICAQIGESCGLCCGCGVCTGGICLPDNNSCGPCRECQDTICVAAPGDKGCTPEGPDTCSDKLWGLMDGDCYAYGPLLGICDAQMECQAQPCESQGAKLVDCDPSCIKDPGECPAGQPAVFDAMQLCEFDGQTELCDTACVPNLNGDITFVNSCHAGLCQEDMKIPCGNYKCKDDLSGCQKDCKDASDCLFSLSCMAGVCKA